MIEADRSGTTVTSRLCQPHYGTYVKNICTEPPKKVQATISTILDPLLIQR